MLELNASRKNKINLSDYNSAQDIANRCLMANLSFFEHEVLQEIFFSSLKIPCQKLARNLGCEEADLTSILQQLSRAGLLSLQDDTIVVDKEMRKYFEFHMKRFDPEFKPDMEYAQGLLRKVPIHLLPSWYAIPRTSNNIFESIVEKYLITPQLFQRYISELHAIHPTAYRMMQEVFAAKTRKIASQELMAKYNLSRPEFEEILLLLEFSFAICAVYTREETNYQEWITPFHEWSEYLHFFRSTDTPSIEDTAAVTARDKTEFAFVESISVTLQAIKVTPLPYSPTNLHHEKLQLTQLATTDLKMIQATDQAADFLNMTLEQKALYLYRHPLNRMGPGNFPQEWVCEKTVREAEKAIRRVLKKGWVVFDEFFKGVSVSLRDDTQIALQKTGKNWSYVIPTYSEQERAFIKAIVFEWLFEAGMILRGEYQGKDCFTVTAFGRFFFEE
jgi:hypothetical protein